jgi:hypothetical protein
VPLEAVLLLLAPADIVVTEPVSASIQQMLLNYMAGASRRCRLEKIQPQQAHTHGRSQSAGSSAQQTAAAGAGGYLDSALMSDLVDFFSSDTPAAAGPGSSSKAVAAPGSSSSKAVAAPDSGSKAVAAPGSSSPAAAGGDTSNEPGSAAALAFILSLPQAVLSALAGALAYLKPFGLADVLRCSSSYRALSVGGALQLDGSALRQLEVLESGGWVGLCAHSHVARSKRGLLCQEARHVCVDNRMGKRSGCHLHSSMCRPVVCLSRTSVEKGVVCNAHRC